MRHLLTAAAAALLLPVAPAAAAPRVPAAPMQLPGDAAASAVRADGATWIVGARPTAASAALAKAAGGSRIIAGSWEVPRASARGLATALRARHLLTYAEPNRYSTLHQAPRAVAQDPLDAQDPWRDAAVDPTLVPPVVTPQSPAVGLVDAKADTSHPEFGSGNVTTLSGQSVQITHGTATAGVAAAPQNGFGMVGVWPGMRAINVPLPADSISCSDSAKGIVRAISAGVAVINMSYGSSSFCETEYEALQLATLKGITLVAAAGNEFDQGNPLEFPASLPHVLTVGASTPDDKAAFFSNENAAMDLVAPGVSIVTTVPIALDTEDGTQDGYEIVDGTSFSAPMVAAASAWVRAARPDLTVDQVAQVIRLSARDIGDPGYDASTGFGALNLAGALVKQPPIADPKEPNDDIRFVDGRAFGKPDKPVWSGGSRVTMQALLDYYEDPYDVYRLRVPAHQRVHVAVTPTFGNPDVELYSSAATQVATAKHRIARSRHSGKAIDRVAYSNHTSRTRTVYVNVYVPRQKTLDAGYKLSVR
ncbi:MAG: in [Solirubrobacteraceae bacterium]|nr:in [Solirubrobacteraceae bacterium]